METVTDTLALDIIEGRKTKVFAAVILMDLTEIAHSTCMNMLGAARKRLVNIQMQNELTDEQDDADNAKHEQEFRNGASL